MLSIAAKIARGWLKTDGRCWLAYNDKIVRSAGRSFKLYGEDVEQTTRDLAKHLESIGFRTKVIKTPAYMTFGPGCDGNWRIHLWEA